MLKTVLIVVLLLILGLVLLGFVASNRIHVDRMIEIQAEAPAVNAILADLRTWPEWSAWTKERDPSVTWEFSGAESGVGAVWTWHGSPPKDGKGLGTGRLEITRSDPQTGIAYDLVFDEDGMKAPGDVVLFQDGVKTRVTWIYEGELGPKPMGGLVKLFMSGMIQDLIGSDFERALAGLKKRVEGTPAEPAAADEG